MHTSCDRYDFDTNSWSSDVPISTTLPVIHSAQSAVHGRHLYMIGGTVDDNDMRTGRVFRLDPQALEQSKELKAKLMTGRAAVAILNDQMFVCGGEYMLDSLNSNSCHSLDLSLEEGQQKWVEMKNATMNYYR